MDIFLKKIWIASRPSDFFQYATVSTPPTMIKIVYPPPGKHSLPTLSLITFLIYFHVFKCLKNRPEFSSHKIFSEKLDHFCQFCCIYFVETSINVLICISKMLLGSYYELGDIRDSGGIPSVSIRPPHHWILTEMFTKISYKIMLFSVKKCSGIWFPDMP